MDQSTQCIFPVNGTATTLSTEIKRSAGFMRTCIQCTDAMYPLLWLHDNGLLVLLGHQHTGGEGRLDHVDDQVIGEDVQFLHLVPGYVGAAGDAISSERGERSSLK